jgi:phage gpG-like protein
MLEVSLTEALEQIGLMLERAADPLPVLTRIGASEVENVRAAITQDKTSPWGDDWAPWAPSTAAHRERKGNADQGLLWDEGDLLRSIRAETHMYGDVGYSTLDVGSDLDYAVFLQDGTDRMPARKYLGWNEHTFAFYELMLMGWMEFGSEMALL